MKWIEQPMILKIWWIIQLAIFIALLVSTPLGAVLFGLFCWYILIPAFSRPPDEKKSPGSEGNPN